MPTEEEMLARNQAVVARLNRLIWAPTLLAALLSLSSACGGSSSPSVDASADVSYVSCAFTSEPARDAQAPCTSFQGVHGDLAQCGIPDASAAGPLPAAACQANCDTAICSLVVDASAVAPGLGSPVIACGCNP
jgi:hypothetical protein